MLTRVLLRCVLPVSALVACTGGTSPPTPRTIDPTLEADAVSATALSVPIHIVFDWSLQDRDARFSGQGVARIEGDRARVDLFGPRGEAYLSAILNGMDLQLPAGVQSVPLPPPALFWSVLGVFKPPGGGTLAAAERDNGDWRLEYTATDQVWRFQLADSSLKRAEWTGGGEGRRSVELQPEDPNGVPREATYRDWPAFLELRMSLVKVETVNGFPSETWTLRRE